MKTQNDILLTRKKCAEFLSVTLPTLNNWIKGGIIRAYQLGGRIYFKKSEILKSLKLIKAIEPK